MLGSTTRVGRGQIEERALRLPVQIRRGGEQISERHARRKLAGQRLHTNRPSPAIPMRNVVGMGTTMPVTAYCRFLCPFVM